MASVAVAILCLAPAIAKATECAPSSRASTCIDLDQLWARPGLADFLAIGPTRVLDPGRIGAGLFATYLQKPLLLHLPSSDPAGTDVNAVGHMLDATALFAIGALPRLDVGVAIPTTLFQDGNGVSALTDQQPAPITKTLLRDPRFSVAYDSFRDDRANVVIRAEATLPLGDRDAFGGSPGPSFAPSIAATFRDRRLVVGAEVGARVRKEASLLGYAFGPQIVEAIGVGYDVLERKRLELRVEAFALESTAAKKSFVIDPTTGTVQGSSAGVVVPSEWLATVRTAFLDGALSLSISGGTGLPLASATPAEPQFRVAVAIRYALDGVSERSPSAPAVQTRVDPLAPTP